MCNPKDIDYLIVNHVEPDHSGSFPLILDHLPNAEIIASKIGVENLKLHYHEEIEEENIINYFGDKLCKLNKISSF